MQELRYLNWLRHRCVWSKKLYFVCFFTNLWKLISPSCSVLSTHDPQVLEFWKEPSCMECLLCRGGAQCRRLRHGVLLYKALCYPWDPLFLIHVWVKDVWIPWMTGVFDTALFHFGRDAGLRWCSVTLLDWIPMFFPLHLNCSLSVWTLSKLFHVT